MTRFFLRFSVLALGVLLLTCGDDKGTGGTPDFIEKVIATILAPSDSSTYLQGDTITFTAMATDEDDSTLGEAVFTWVSDQDDTIGTGATLKRHDLSIATHTIVVTATAEDTISGEDTITLQIDEPPPPDTIPPAKITDLTVDSMSSRQMFLSWTSPGDDSTEGTALIYDLRFSRVLLDDDEAFDTAAVVGLEPPPEIAGTKQSYTISGLTSGVQYTAAIRTADSAHNWSPLSNMAVGITELELLDSVDTFEPDDDSTTATFIVHQEVQLHTLDTTEDEDWFRFTTTGPNFLRFQFDGPEGLIVAPPMELFDSTGTVIRVRNCDDCSDGDCNNRECESIRLTFNPLPAGTYYIAVARGGGFKIIPYKIKMELISQEGNDD